MPQIIGIDTSGLNRALAISQQYSERTPEIMVATAGYFIASKTSKTVRRTAISSIDSALGVDATLPVLVTRGARRGLPRKDGKKQIVLSGGQQNLAMRIILARFYPGSGYNLRTNQRWALDRASFSPGEGQAGFWAKVSQKAQAMVGQRHGATAFLASALIPIIQFLATRCDARYRRGAAPDPDAARHSRQSKYKLGEATLTTGLNKATLKGDLLVGMNPSPLGEQQNAALHRWVSPALQNSIYDEETSQMAYAAAKEEMLLRGGQLASAGVRVS